MQLFPALLATTAAPAGLATASSFALAELVGAGTAAGFNAATAAAGTAGAAAGWAGIGNMLSGIGTGISAIGTIAAGKQADAFGRVQQQASELEAKQLEAAGKEEFAEKQREMFALRRQKRLALSQLTARSAGSGFSADDPSTLALADEIEQYGTLQEQTALYGGQRRKSDLDFAAAGRRFEGSLAASRGRQARRGSYFDAASTIMGGVTTMADRFAPRRATASSAGRYG